MHDFWILTANRQILDNPLDKLIRGSAYLPKNQNSIGFLGKMELCGLECYLNKDKVALFSLQVKSNDLEAYLLPWDAVDMFITHKVKKNLVKKTVDLIQHRS